MGRGNCRPKRGFGLFFGFCLCSFDASFGSDWGGADTERDYLHGCLVQGIVCFFSVLQSNAFLV